MFRSSVTQVFTVVLISLVSVACSADPEKVKQEYQRNGDRFLAEKNYTAAIVEYRNAIEQDARFGEARYKLAQAYGLMGNWGRARDEFIRAADLLPTNAEVQVAAGRALLRAGEYQDARTRAELALKIDPKHTNAHILRGEAASGLNDLEASLDAFEEGLVARPDQSELYVNVGIVKAAQGNKAEAEASFKQAVALAPKSVSARLALANYYRAIGRTADVEPTLNAALAMDQKNLLTNRALAAFYIASNRGAEAEAPLRRAAEATEDPNPKLVLADYYVSQKRQPDALKILEQLATVPGVYAAATARRAGIEYTLNRRDEAHRILDDLIAKEPTNAQALVAKSRWLIAEQKMDEAFITVGRALKLDAEAWEAHDLMGSIQVARRQHDAAFKSFGEAIRLNPRASNAQIELAELSLILGKPGNAVQLAQAAVQSQPLSGRARYILVRALVANGDAERARTEALPILLGSPNNAAVAALLGSIELKRGDLAAARRAFDRAYAIDPKSPETLAGLLGLDQASKQLPQAVKRVEAYVAQNPTSAVGQYLAARTYAAAGDLSRAETAVKKTLELDPTQLRAYSLLGEVYGRQRKLDEARQEYEQIIARRPNDVAAHTMIGMLLETQQKPAEARKVYERILAIDPRAAAAANNLAYMDAEEGTNLNRALNLAQAAKAELPNDPDVNDTLGWVYYKLDMATMAVVPLEQSVRQDPSNALYQYHLGLAYLKAGDNAKARVALERALKLQPNFEGADDATKTLATLQTKSG